MNISRIIILLLLSTTLQAQNTITLSGFVKDIENGEVLMNAYVIDSSNTNGTSTNSYGYFSINVPKGNIYLKFSYVGYEPVLLNGDIQNDTIVEILLTENLVLDEVLVNGAFNSLNSNYTGIETMSAKMVNALPVIMGETDIVKTLTLLPGVSFGNEATSGYFVRGSSSDQNLLLLDGVPIYNPYHLRGYFSVFNTDAINNATLYKGAVPANYGGRLASVLDINMKEGNSKQYSGALTLGTIMTKVLFEGPIKKDKTSFLITARRSMLDVMNPHVSSALAFFNGISRVANNDDVTTYYFYDYNAKVNHKINDRNKIYFNLYKSKDNFLDKNTQSGLKNASIWENSAYSAGWNHIYSNKLFGNFTFYHSNYQYSSTDALFIEDLETHTGPSIGYKTAITDYSIKSDYYYSLNKHSLKFGAQYLNQTLSPEISTHKQIASASGQNMDTTYSSSFNTHTAILYIEDEFKPNEKIAINAGLHFSGYYTKDKFYPSIQPRFSINYKPIEKISIKGSYTRMVQNLHLLSTSWSGNPSDIWVPSTNAVKPENSNQIATGITYNAGQFYITSEVFLKNMNNLIDYKEGASYFNDQSDWQNKIETGSGKAYGFEFSLKKDQGKISGLLSYTYSKSTRKFEKINNGIEFPYTYDRTHSISAALIYKINKKWSFGANWIFATGKPASASDTYLINTFEYPKYYKLYHSVNGIRFPNYHRLDISMNYKKMRKRYNSQLSLGFYNIYNRKNPYSLFDDDDHLVVNSLLGISPYITLIFKLNK